LPIAVGHEVGGAVRPEEGFPLLDFTFADATLPGDLSGVAEGTRRARQSLQQPPDGTGNLRLLRIDLGQCLENAFRGKAAREFFRRIPVERCDLEGTAQKLPPQIGVERVHQGTQLLHGGFAVFPSLAAAGGAKKGGDHPFIVLSMARLIGPAVQPGSENFGIERAGGHPLFAGGVEASRHQPLGKGLPEECGLLLLCISGRFFNPLLLGDAEAVVAYAAHRDVAYSRLDHQLLELCLPAESFLRPGKNAVEEEKFLFRSRPVEGDHGDATVEQGRGEVTIDGISLVERSIADQQRIPGNPHGQFLTRWQQVTKLLECLGRGSGEDGMIPRIGGKMAP